MVTFAVGMQVALRAKQSACVVHTLLVAEIADTMLALPEMCTMLQNMQQQHQCNNSLHFPACSERGSTQALAAADMS